jgi:hypothetical protein
MAECFDRHDRPRPVELQVPRLPPGFLSGLVALVNFMRLSLKKAAYVAVDESSVVGNPEFARDDKVGGLRFHAMLSLMDR